MLKTHPVQGRVDTRMLSDCLEACVECMEICNSCADACLGEKQVDSLKHCIRLNRDCADICEATVRILSRLTETDWRLVHGVVEAMVTACNLCAEECERHADMHEHCRVHVPKRVAVARRAATG